MYEPTAESRITVGSARLSTTTSHRRCGPSAAARAMNTGRTSAARPEVAGMANAVATTARVSRWTRPRGVRHPAARCTAARTPSPEAATAPEMTKAPMSSHVVSSPSASKASSASMTPMSTSVTAAPSAM